VPGVALRILDDAGNALAAAQTGEIAVRSPRAWPAYFRDPRPTAAALRDGWFLTGDLGCLDEDGWLYFVDRKRDVIRRGGENVSSVLSRRRSRASRGRRGRRRRRARPGARPGDQGVRRRERPVTDDELRAFAARRLAKFQVPRLWEFRERCRRRRRSGSRSTSSAAREARSSSRTAALERGVGALITPARRVAAGPPSPARVGAEFRQHLALVEAEEALLVVADLVNAGVRVARALRLADLLDVPLRIGSADDRLRTRSSVIGFSAASKSDGTAISVKSGPPSAASAHFSCAVFRAVFSSRAQQTVSST
jgi:hypothetical protein